jgi:hypothetical protein
MVRDTPVRTAVPLGSAEDSEYLPPGTRWLSRRLFAVPPAVARLQEVAGCRYATLRYLIDAPDLSFISVWNPSFLTLLMRALDERFDELVDDLQAGQCRVAPALPGLRRNVARARWLRTLRREQGVVSARDLWPRLALISLWTDAQAARAEPDVAARFAGVERQGKGLLATEGVVTIPLIEAPAPVLAVRSHFFEFLEEGRSVVVRLAHELDVGREYEVLLSTSGGLLRYRLGDRVRVEGLMRRTPCLRFMGRADAVSDLVGEKLSASRVADVLADALAGSGTAPRFLMLAPEWLDPPCYLLFIESDAPESALERVGERVEARLSDGVQYRYARRLGQLGPVRVVRVRDGWHRYEARCVALRQRAGSVKPTDLHTEPGWLSWLAPPRHVASEVGA